MAICVPYKAHGIRNQLKLFNATESPSEMHLAHDICSAFLFCYKRTAALSCAAVFVVTVVGQS